MRSLFLERLGLGLDMFFETSSFLNTIFDKIMLSYRRETAL